jgi:hypothetical protein
MQASLPKAFIPLGATNLLAVISTSCAIFTAIGQTVFQERLSDNLSGIVSPDVLDKIISAGATNLDSAISPEVPDIVSPEYSRSITEATVSDDHTGQSS